MKHLLILVTALWTVGCANLTKQQYEKTNVEKKSERDNWKKKQDEIKKQQEQDYWNRKLQESKKKTQENVQKRKIESEQLYMMGVEFYKKKRP